MVKFKYLVKSMQSVFQRSIMNGRVFCGAACFHTYNLCFSAKYLNSLLKNSSIKDFLGEMNENKISPKFFILTLIKQLKKIFTKYLKCLLEHDLDEYKIDIESGHLFYVNSKNLKCECGLFVLENIKKDDLGLIEFSDDFSLLEKEILLTFNKNSIRLTKKEENLRLIDCYESKINCFKVIRDIISSIYQIGVFVYN